MNLPRTGPQRIPRCSGLSPLVIASLLFAALTSLPTGARAQSPEIAGERPVLDFLSVLVDQRCEIRESWPDGNPFHLDKEFDRGLEGRIIIENSFTVDEQGARRPRNHGVRAYPRDSDDARFWEFDRFGNVSEGPVWVESGTLYYEYPYGTAGQVLRDSWTPAGEGLYSFKIRQWENGEWGQTFMDGTYRCSPVEDIGG